MVNKNATKSPELLAKYCDILLKKGNKNMEDSELEEKLNQIVCRELTLKHLLILFADYFI